MNTSRRLAKRLRPRGTLVRRVPPHPHPRGEGTAGWRSGFFRGRCSWSTVRQYPNLRIQARRAKMLPVPREKAELRENGLNPLKTDLVTQVTPMKSHGIGPVTRSAVLARPTLDPACTPHCNRACCGSQSRAPKAKRGRGRHRYGANRSNSARLSSTIWMLSTFASEADLPKALRAASVR